MSPIKKIRLGLELIEQIAPDDQPQYTHDIIFAGVNTPDAMSEERKKALIELGWRHNTEYNCWQHY